MRRILCEACEARPGNPICGLPAGILADFRAAGSALLYRPRQVIFSEGMPASALYLVCHGAVKLYHCDRFGREHIIEIAAPGALLGELSLDEGDVMSAAAEALTEVQVLYLARERLAAFVERHPETAVRFLAALSRELAIARRKVRELALKSGESRLAGLLLQLAGAEGVDGVPVRSLHLPYTRRDLAAMIGVSTETVIRLLTALKRKGTIATVGRQVSIADLDRLARIAQHDDATFPTAGAGADDAQAIV
jgi:CRP/FNR family transcriptional regulator